MSQPNGSVSQARAMRQKPKVKVVFDLAAAWPLHPSSQPDPGAWVLSGCKASHGQAVESLKPPARTT
jgi:hypothetical protein